MWRETILIVPQLEPGGAQKLETNLNGRFSNISKKFGLTLRNFMRGAFLGVGLAFLQKLLNPIDHLEERLRDLLNQSRDLSDTAARIGASPGELKRTQDVAKSFGVAPEQFKELLGKFTDAIFTGRREMADPFSTRSDSTVALKEFLNDSDILGSFKTFLSNLKGVEVNKGTVARTRVEEAVFGSDLFGGARRFAESDMEAQARRLGLPSAAASSLAIAKGSSIESATQSLYSQREGKSFVSDINALNTTKLIAAISEQEIKGRERQTKQLESFSDLKSAAASLEAIKNFVEDTNNEFLKGISQWPDAIKEGAGALIRQMERNGGSGRLLERAMP